MRAFPVAVLLALAVRGGAAPTTEPGLLFHLSGDHGTTADFSAAGTPKPTYEAEVKPVADGARGTALECGNYQLLAYRAPGNVYAQRGTLSFFWRSRYPVGPTAFPLFRIAYADHSSWDMVFLRVDYNGGGFDAFVTDASLARTRVSFPLAPFPEPKTWTHLAVAWDENRGLRFYVNGKLAGKVDTRARYDLALDQFGPHSRVISPYQVQSDYNFVRGGDIDEVRIYDHMLPDDAVGRLARGEPAGSNAASARSLTDPEVRDEWAFRHGWNHNPPPALPDSPTVTIRKVEIHDTYDMKRWWWKANDGIRETTWPGVYNRSRLPGRHDYFELPDWDCYVESGKSVTFALPDEPWNQFEISGSAWGNMELLPSGVENETAYLAKPESKLFGRARGQERTVHRLASPITGRKIRFTNTEPEEPIGELSAYHVTAGAEPAGSTKLAYRLGGAQAGPALASLVTFINGRFEPDERTVIIATRAGTTVPASAPAVATAETLPLVHILIPNSWDDRKDGLDGIAIELPALTADAATGLRVPLNLQVKDPVWPLRNMLDVTFTVKPGERHTLWIDLRDRLLPPGKALWLSLAAGTSRFSATTLHDAELRLVFKPREAARTEHEIDRFTQVRDVYAMMVEEHPANQRLDMWNRFKADLDDLLRVNPEHVRGRQYAAAGSNAPWPPLPEPEPPAGVPLWAFRQVTLLGHVKRFVGWYIDHRQVPYGDFGGGISDDVDLLNTWPGVALMGCIPDKIRASNAALLDAAYANGMFARGLPAIQADELHSYEEGINCLGQNLIVAFGSPRQLERAMETARGIESITGINPAGHRHIRTSYYSGTRMAVEDPWGYAKPYSYLVLQVPELLIDYNGSPAARKTLLELADGLLAHRAAGGDRRLSVPAIHFATDREDDVGRNYFPSHVFWGAYKFTGDRKYLAPVFDNPVTALSLLNANVIDLLDLRTEWAARVLGGEEPMAVEGRRDAGRTKDRASGFRATNTGHFAWQLSGDKSHLEKLYAEQSRICASLEYINTEGSLWIDRVGVPVADLQRARLGGVALVRNGIFPGHVISWRFTAPANDQSVAVLVPRATATAIRVLAYNLETIPVRATMTGWNVDPGHWEIAQSVDADGDDEPDGPGSARVVPFERGGSIDMTLPPRTTTVLTLTLKQPATPYWNRPDIGIDPQDVVVRDGDVRVTVHSLGSVPAPGSSVALRDSSGHIVAIAAIPEIPAPVDLFPKTVEVLLALPPGFNAEGGSVELNPHHQFEEITTVNNRVRLK